MLIMEKAAMHVWVRRYMEICTFLLILLWTYNCFFKKIKFFLKNDFLKLEENVYEANTHCDKFGIMCNLL